MAEASEGSQFPQPEFDVALRPHLLLLHPVTEDMRAQPPCLLTRRAANLSKVPSEIANFIYKSSKLVQNFSQKSYHEVHRQVEGSLGEEVGEE